jgi:hypothetical protein
LSRNPQSGGRQFQIDELVQRNALSRRFQSKLAMQSLWHSQMQFSAEAAFAERWRNILA